MRRVPSRVGPRDGDVVVLEYWGKSSFANTAQLILGLPASRPIDFFASAS
jgi:hypothetical protein